MVWAREPASTIKFLDDYFHWYKKLFSQVRSFEAFKYLHVGMISDIKRKTLPAIARVVGLRNEQGLLHFLTESTSKLEQLRQTKLKLILQVLAGREITRIIDETGDIATARAVRTLGVGRTPSHRVDTQTARTACEFDFPVKTSIAQSY
jgi:SRSO17 transposase